MRVIISIDNDYIGRTNEVAEQLKIAGLEIDTILEVSGIITGSALAPDSLKEIKGVACVEEDEL